MMDLIHSLALLVALSAVSGFVGRRLADSVVARLLHGVVFGLAAVISMLEPLSFPEGIQIDGRSVAVSVCGLFFGPLAAGVACFMAVACRIALGGEGMIAGTAVVLTSGAIGVLGHRWWRDTARGFTVLRAWGMGLAVHAVMLLLISTLPGSRGQEVLTVVALPVMVFFPLVTSLIASMLSDQRARQHFVQRLEESEDRFRMLLEHTPAAIAMFDREMKYLLASRRWYTDYGLDGQCIIGRSHYEVFPEISDEWKAIHQRCLAGEMDAREEDRFERADGRVDWVRWIIIPWRDARGDVGGIVIFSEVITKRKEAENALAKSDERFHQLADAMPLIVWTADPDGAITYTSQALVPYTGMSREAAQGHSWGEFVHQDDEAGVREAWLEAVRTGKPHFHEVRLRHHDGEYRWNQVQSVPVRDEEGNIVKWYGTATDIHATKLNEDAMAQMAARLTTTLESITDAFYTLDRDWRFTYLNGEAERLLQCSRDEVLGRPALEVFPEIGETEIPANFLEAARGGHTVEFESYYEPLARWFEARIYPSSEGLAVYFRDTSHQKETERERERLEEQLRQAQKLEAVGRLAGGVAHDFNNMLGVILGYTDMAMLQSDENAPLRADLEQIKLAASRSAELTGQLLAFARKQTIAPKVLDLNETVDKSLKMLGRLIGEDIHIVWKPGADGCRVKMDPTQVDQILANLAVNARDALAGHGTFTIETHSAVLDREYCRHNAGLVPGAYTQLSVSDNGCGMDEITLTQVFEPFFTTKPQGEGTGLGLATVYGIVKQNDGLIAVTSAPGQGTRFDIYLPQYTGSDMEPAAGVDENGTPGGAETLLLVEDEQALLALGARQLRHLGYNVLAAASPREALKLAKEHSQAIDLLVTDVVMPEMDGRELWRMLDSIQPGIRTLFMSGYTADAIAHHGTLDDGVHFLQKPFKMEEFAAKVREALEDDAAVD